MEYYLNQSELIDRCNFSWDELYSNDADKQAFLKRLGSFLSSSPATEDIVHIDDQGISYSSESYITPRIDDKKANLMLILGNPAPESVAMKAMFAHENHGKRYHRFWRILDDVGLLRFPQDPDTLAPHTKMQKLYANDYESPFNIFIVPYYSFPTPPGGKWSGVAGIRRLFGNGFPKVSTQDGKRIQSLFDTHIKDGDSIVTFQKDAFISLSETQERSTDYNYRNLLNQPAVSDYHTRQGAQANLICMLPTRLLHSRQSKTVLSRIAIGEVLT